ncbi:hypothetical protein RN001_013384 [Aquatica leii]|uniref:Peptidase S1 domain-containing protein n=1 Tax=Aquatica leii TaxID=1421715 RepID=A0AAN7PQJ6_9COLE|nr:hypothetical protein RN001_013384 [Aquatica leii]
MNPITKTFILLAFFCLISVGISIRCYNYVCEKNCDVLEEPRAARKIVECAPNERCAVMRPYKDIGTIFRVMKSIVYCVIFLFVAVVGDHCGYQKVANNLDIGGDAQPGEMPWLVQIHLKTRTGKILENACVGSLINKRFVLTSAICAHNSFAVLSKAVLGQHDTTVKNCNNCHLQEIEIENVTSNEYVKNTRANDIALIKLKEDVTFTEYVQPVCLPIDEQLNVGEKVVSSGWGMTKTGVFANLKKKVISTITSTKDCQKTLEGIASLADTHFCTEALNENKDWMCSGDSGGPIVYLKDGRWYQQGIVSFGVGCGVGLPDVNTNVAKYLNWIKENMKVL